MVAISVGMVSFIKHNLFKEISIFIVAYLYASYNLTEWGDGKKKSFLALLGLHFPSLSGSDIIIIEEQRKGGAPVSATLEPRIKDQRTYLAILANSGILCNNYIVLKVILWYPFR